MSLIVTQPVRTRPVAGICAGEPLTADAACSQARGARLSWLVCRPSGRTWEFGAPEIARLGMARLNAAGVAMLGTVRRDGSPPRTSPVEPYLVAGQKAMRSYP
jgi:hypothetical protein